MDKQTVPSSSRGKRYVVSYISDSVARITAKAEGNSEESLLSRYGIIPAETGPAAFVEKEDTLGVSYSTETQSVILNSSTGRFEMRVKADDNGSIVSGEFSPKEGGGFELQIPLEPEDRIFGLGDVTRDRLEKRGFRTAIWVRNVASYVPVPVLLSFRGWGIFLNSTYKVTTQVPLWPENG